MFGIVTMIVCDILVDKKFNKSTRFKDSKNALCGIMAAMKKKGREKMKNMKKTITTILAAAMLMTQMSGFDVFAAQSSGKGRIGGTSSG